MEAISALVAPGGALLVVAHAPGADLGTYPVTAEELIERLPAFDLVRVTPTELAGGAAQRFELIRRT
jgi:hypothetical protein